MAFDKAFAITVMHPAASSAYDVMNVPAPAPHLPAGFITVGLIQAAPPDPAVTAAVDEVSRLLARRMAGESGIFGFVAWNATTETAIVSIRGTQTVLDWLDNIDGVAVPYLPAHGAGMVHMGFQLVYMHIRASITGLLRARCPGIKAIWVTGHSLGGALAVLCAFDLLKNLGAGVVPEVYTFAAPRAGAPDFAKTFDAAIPVCHRVVNFMDAVPQVPLPPLFKHTGLETLVRGGFKPLDPVYAHGLGQYMTGLQKPA